MFRIITTFVFVAVTSIIVAQKDFSFVLTGQIFNATGEKIKFIQQTENNQELVIAEIKLDKKGNFSKAIKVKDKDYYILRLEDNQAINIIVQNSDTIKVFGDGRTLFYNTNIINSDASSAMLEFSRISSVYKVKLDSANQYLQANMDKQRQIQQEFQPVHQEFLKQRQSFIVSNPNSPALLATLATFNVESEFEIYTKVVDGLKNGFGDSPTIKRVAAEYENNKRIVHSKMPMAPGSMAKEIALPNPEGDTLRLSDYRGKVVLIDFWAAWCGPCRRENPNVVKVYEKYKDKGFEVFSVSLDKTLEAWTAAIEQDKLTWPGHVSDLKFWQSEAAKAYKVNSIPFTVLIDQEGKVIGTNYRGPALEQKLQEIFD